MNPQFKQIGNSFIEAYYGSFDTKENRAAVQPFYHENALLTFEGQEFQGPVAIIQKLLCIPYYQRAITCADYQPTLDGGVICTIIGQLKTDSEHDKPMPFTHVFSLKPLGDGFFIFNEIFRISFHNF